MKDFLGKGKKALGGFLGVISWAGLALTELYVMPLPHQHVTQDSEVRLQQDGGGRHGPVSAPVEGCRGVLDPHPQIQDKQRAQRGDLAWVHYTIGLEDGTVLETTHKAPDPNQGERGISFKWGTGSPQLLLVGEDGSIPGMVEALEGMTIGQKKVLVLPQNRAYGPQDPHKLMFLPCVRKIPSLVRMDPEQYVSRFKGFPLVGAEVRLVPYLKARVIEVTETMATLEVLATQGEVFQDDFGDTLVTLENGDVTLTLRPKVGAPFEVQGRQGRILATDGTTFTVDFNHPGAGRPVVLEVELISLVKASTLAKEEILWIDKPDTAIQEAKTRGKPLVLVLYAPWCSWSKKLLEETMRDPRIKALKGDFVWAKVDSDHRREVGSVFGQKGFPLTVVVDPEEGVLERIEGFKPPQAISRVLVETLASKKGPGITSRPFEP